jgi:hypothetical protein
LEKVRSTTTLRMPGREHDGAAHRVGRRDELGVGLVEDDEHVGGDAREERVECRLGHDRAGRVVGRADDDHAGAVGDGGGHRVEVVAARGRVRHGDAGRAGDRRELG